MLLFAIRKDVFNTKWKDSEIYPPLKDIVENIEYGVYDKDLIYYYDDDEWDKLNSYLNHNRDMMFAHQLPTGSGQVSCTRQVIW